MLALVEHLPEDSAFVASRRGGHRWRGWTQTERILADLYDAINLNTVATGQWAKGKAPTIPPYPRPTNEKPRVLKIADIRAQYGKLGR